MKYIITGGAGFIGSYFAEALLSAGQKVLIVDNLSTGSIDNISALLNNRNLQFLQQSIEEVRHWEDIISDDDVVIHLAATVGVNKVVLNSLETVENNFYPTKLLLAAAIKRDCKFFFASTSEVYGELNNTYSRESDPLAVPSSHCGRSAYVLGKLMSEHYCLNFFKTHSLKVIVGRFFNVTGARQLDAFGMVVPTFIRQALSGHPITIYGEGKQTRSFANVNEVVHATLKLLDAENAFGEVFNIGSEESISIYELASYIRNATGSPSSLVFLPHPSARASFRDIHHRKPCLDKIKSFIPLKPGTPWQITIDAIIRHHKQLQKNTPYLKSAVI